MAPEVGHAWNVAVTDSGFERRDLAFTNITSWRFVLKCLGEIASEDDSADLHEKEADKQRECNTSRPPLGALVVDVIGDCAIGARLVGRYAELASHASLQQPMLSNKREHGTRKSVQEMSLVKVFLLRSTVQWCWLVT